MTKLTPKQQAFAVNRAAGVKNREAAIAAGYATNAADVTAAKLMRRADIKAAIKNASKVSDDEDGIGPTSKLRTNYNDSLEFMRDVMNNPKMVESIRFEAAKQLLPYEHARIGEKGKKQTAKERAEEIAGRPRAGGTTAARSPKAPPVLRSIRGGKDE